MTAALDALVSLLDLEVIEVNIFRGVSPDQGLPSPRSGLGVGRALVSRPRVLFLRSWPRFRSFRVSTERISPPSRRWLSDRTSAAAHACTRKAIRRRTATSSCGGDCGRPPTESCSGTSDAWNRSGRSASRWGSRGTRRSGRCATASSSASRRSTSSTSSIIIRRYSGRSPV